MEGDIEVRMEKINKVTIELVNIPEKAKLTHLKILKYLFDNQEILFAKNKLMVYVMRGNKENVKCLFWKNGKCSSRYAKGLECTGKVNILPKKCPYLFNKEG